ncbi:alginate export family protein [Pseudomonas sp. MWU16-30317]|uniref:alginate export family protein n=1 Tax=Pseudomonas sp. MWU16-30317 TaxID=2878095 RepID=UPI001CF9F77C|nr:alginate export family protein [Pseudomonas sp. MWU16-30317]
MKLNKWMKAGIGLGFAALWSCPTLAALTASQNFGIEVKATGQSEDDRDLGTRSGGDVNGVGIDLRPWAYLERGQWAFYAMGQAVAASDVIQTDPLDEQNATAPSVNTSGINHNSARDGNDAYFAMREFWVSYQGLFTPYPGENAKFGRQRLRNDDGQWRDDNIEALTWNLDTTLLKSHLGVAERFSDYRTDYDQLSAQDKQRLHAFGDAYYQWMPGQWIGVRAHYVKDDGKLADAGKVVDDLDKRVNSKIGWVGLDANSDAYNYRNLNQVNYWGSVTFMDGSQDLNSAAYDANNLTTDASGHTLASPKSNRDLSGWGSDLGIRLRLDPQWQVGGAYSQASKNYEQNGLQSNRSTWTGTRSRISRFGEAYQAQMGNTRVASVFASWQQEDQYDASLIYHKFWRVDGNSGIGGSNINAVQEDINNNNDISFNTLPLNSGSKDLGQEVDLVVTKYFKQGLLPAALSQSIDEPSALIRLRAGLFKPGDAYGSGVDNYMHRAIVDVIWRF